MPKCTVQVCHRDIVQDIALIAALLCIKSLFTAAIAATPSNPLPSRRFFKYRLDLICFMPYKSFKAPFARISSSNPGAVRPVLKGLIKKGSVKEEGNEFVVEATMEGASAKELNRALLSELRRAEKKTSSAPSGPQTIRQKNTLTMC